MVTQVFALYCSTLLQQFLRQGGWDQMVKQGHTYKFSLWLWFINVINIYQCIEVTNTSIATVQTEENITKNSVVKNVLVSCRRQEKMPATELLISLRTRVQCKFNTTASELIFPQCTQQLQQQGQAVSLSVIFYCYKSLPNVLKHWPWNT